MNATITHITEGTIAEQTGLEKGDVVLSINNHPVNDVIDYMFYSRENVLNLKIRRNNKEHSFKIKKKDNAPIGFEIKPFRTKT